MGGSTAAQAISGGVIQKWDPVPFDIPAGAKFWERTVHTAGNIGLLELPAFPSVIGVDDGVADGDLGASGTIPAATARVGIAGSQWIEGTIKVGNAKSYVIIGDSIAWSQGDNESVGAKHGSGYQARALDNVASWMKAAIPGQQAADLVALLANADTRVSTLMQAIPASDAWFEHGVNDLRLGRTQAQLLADYATIAASQKSGRRISQSTLTPRTTGDWSTVAGQTVQTDGNWAALNSVNAAIRAPQSYVNGKIHEVADLAMSARDSEKWQAPPVPVADGTHPNSYMAALIAAGLTFN